MKKKQKLLTVFVAASISFAALWVTLGEERFNRGHRSHHAHWEHHHHCDHHDEIKSEIED